MVTATSPVLAHNGNPGIVPAYLANNTAPPTAPAAPQQAGAATQVHPALRLGTAPSATGAAAQATTGAGRVSQHGFIPIIIITGGDGGFGGESFPGGGGGRSGGGGWTIGGQPEPTPRDPMPGEDQAATGAMRDIKSFWTKMGVGPREGNGPGPDIQYMDNYPNASYDHGNGQELMEIGIDPDTNKSYALSKDVLAHEYAHRVVTHILDLNPVGESGAVNESLADTFAAAVDTSNWTIGENSHTGGIRDMQHPERPQEVIHLPGGRDIHMPGNMRDYVHTRLDNGGVHINMGIPNKAAAFIGEQLGRDTMAQIYLGAIRKYMPQDGGIADLANATMQSTADQFGERSKQEQTVINAWKNVGVVDSPGGSQPQPAPQPRDTWGGQGRW